MTLLVGGAVVGSMVTLPARAAAGPVRSTPGAGQVVRAVDPSQTKLNPATPPYPVRCPDFAWGGTSAIHQHPCDVLMVLNQPIVPTEKVGDATVVRSTLALFGPNDDTSAVAGTVWYRDSGNSTAAGSATSNVPGADTVILTPSAPLAAGTYLARVTVKDSLSGTMADCDPDGGTVNCFEWRFTVGAAPTPTITSPADGASLTSRLVTVEGTADPNALIDILNAADASLGTGQAGPDGTFSIEIPAAAGSNTIKAEATSRLATTAERVWAAYEACVAGTETGLDPDVDEILVEEECGAAPPSAPVPVLTSAASSFTATVTGDVEAPTIAMETAPDTIQSVDAHADPTVPGSGFIPQAPAIHGHASDNDQIENVVVTVKDITGATVTDYEVTFDKAAKTEWEIHFTSILNRYTVSVKVVDTTGNVSEEITTTYTVTYGNTIQDALDEVPE